MAHFSSDVHNRLYTTGPDMIEYLDTAWDDMQILPGAFSFPGVSDPTRSVWQPGGSGAVFTVYKFEKNDIVGFTCQVPHTYKQGTDIKAHIHWTPCDRGAAEGVGALVGWKLDISWVNVNGVFVPSTTVDLSDACTGVDDQHEVSASVAVVGTGKNISSMIAGNIYRSDTGTDDTWAGATAVLSPAILEVDFHFEIDMPGSREEFTK